MTNLRPLRLRPHDVVVALQLVLTPEATYPALAEAIGISLGESHNAVKRLQASRLLGFGTRDVQKRGLMDFLLHGLPFAFPASPGRLALGVPTAHAGPALKNSPSVRRSPARPPMVWPAASGKTHGASLAPMCPRAPLFIEENPELYRLLTVIDALRLGRDRGSHGVERALRQEIYGGFTPIPSGASRAAGVDATSD